VRAEDFSLAAASLHIGGQIEADFSGPRPSFTGNIDAPSLTLPRFDARSQASLPFGVIANWQGQLHLHAGEILWGATSVAVKASADLAASGGVLAAYFSDARIAGGRFAGGAVIDSTQPAPALVLHAGLTGATLDDLPDLPPLAFKGGSLDIATDLSGRGYSPAALLATATGDAHATLRGAALTSVDLPLLTKLLNARAPGLRSALTAAMAEGDTGPLTGDATAELQQGAITLRTHLTGDAGSVDIDGSVDLPQRTSDLALQIAPSVANPPALGLRLVGPWQGGKRVINIRPALLWAGEGTTKKARGSAPRTPSR
jgi:uncharacterized protein involved in outer membrane biogenesis